MQLIDARESFTKMRKSLGEKRKQLSDDQIADLVRLYGSFEPGARGKIFDNEDFGFLRITVERPLRLRWELTADGIEQLSGDKKFAKLAGAEQASILADLGAQSGSAETDASAAGDGSPPGELAVRRLAKAAMKRAGVSGKPIENAIVDAMAITDPEAPTVTGAKGHPEPDAQLRDAENVPLSVDAVGHVRYEPDATERLATSTYRKPLPRKKLSARVPRTYDS